MPKSKHEQEVLRYLGIYIKICHASPMVMDPALSYDLENKYLAKAYACLQDLVDAPEQDPQSYKNILNFLSYHIGRNKLTDFYIAVEQELQKVNAKLPQKPSLTFSFSHKSRDLYQLICCHKSHTKVF